jgi:hypothetical protein
MTLTLTREDRRYLQDQIAEKRNEIKHLRSGAIPPRDYEYDDGSVETGIPGNRLEVDAITGVEIAPDEVDTPHLKTAAVNNDKLAGTSVSTGKLQDQAATGDKIAKNPHGIDPLGNANQNDDPLRAISGDHVKTKTLEGFHFKDGAIGGRAVSLSMGDIGGSLGPGRVPSLGRMHGKVKAHSQIDWGNNPSIPPSAVRDGYDYRRLDHKPNLKKFLTRADFRADGTLKR